MDETDRLIDTAIKTYPLAPLPPGFTQRLMGRINPTRPTIRLSMLDWLLPVFFTIFGVGIVVSTWLTIPLLDPLWIPRLKLAYQVFILRMALLSTRQPVLLPVAVILGVVVLAGTLTGYFLVRLSLNRFTPARSSTSFLKLLRR